MARFRATIQGNRGKASRCGHQKINAVVNGWNLGASFRMVKRSLDGGPTEDHIEVRITSGSNNQRPSKVAWIGTEVDFVNQSCK